MYRRGDKRHSHCVTIVRNDLCKLTEALFGSLVANTMSSISAHVNINRCTTLHHHANMVSVCDSTKPQQSASYTICTTISLLHNLIEEMLGSRKSTVALLGATAALGTAGIKEVYCSPAGSYCSSAGVKEATTALWAQRRLLQLCRLKGYYSSAGLKEGYYSSAGLKEGYYSSAGLKEGYYSSAGLKEGYYSSAGLKEGYYSSAGLKEGYYSSAGVKEGYYSSAGIKEGYYSSVGSRKATTALLGSRKATTALWAQGRLLQLCWAQGRLLQQHGHLYYTTCEGLVM